MKKRSRAQKVRTAHDKAWKVFSQYIRARNADHSGYAKCFTCDIVKPWKELQAGHYIHGSLDFDEVNVNPQCPRCNKWLSGNLGVYGEKLISIYGEEKIKQLRVESKQLKKYTLDELQRIHNKYQRELELLDRQVSGHKVPG